MNSRKIKNDIIGLKFGRLTVLEFIGSKNRNSRYNKLLRVYRCLCDCGIQCEKFGTDLRSGSASSCDCLRKEIQTKIHTGRISPQRNTAGAQMSTAKEIWRKTYSDGISFENFIRLSQLNCYYCGAAPSNKI